MGQGSEIGCANGKTVFVLHLRQIIAGIDFHSGRGDQGRTYRVSVDVLGQQIGMFRIKVAKMVEPMAAAFGIQRSDVRIGRQFLEKMLGFGDPPGDFSGVEPRHGQGQLFHMLAGLVDFMGDLIDSEGSQRHQDKQYPRRQPQTKPVPEPCAVRRPKH